MQTIQYPCTICGNVQQHKAFDVKSYTYYRCGECGTVALYPIPSFEELAQYYNSIYRVNPDHTSPALQRKWRSVARTIGSYLPAKGKLLDVGSSWGSFLAAARDEGWQTNGVELSSEAVTYSRERLELDVFAGTLPESPYANQTFDAATAWHVIEHDRDPQGFLRAIAGCVRPGGIVALTTPNVASLIARLGGPGWEWSTPPAHLFLLTPRAVRLLLQEAGLEPILITTRRGDARPLVADLAIALVKRLGLGRRAKGMLAMPDFEAHDQTGRSPRHNPRLRLLFRAITLLDTLGIPFRPLARFLYHRFGWGPELMVVARKTR